MILRVGLLEVEISGRTWKETERQATPTRVLGVITRWHAVCGTAERVLWGLMMVVGNNN